MGGATTFAELIAAPASEKIVLAEINVGQLLEGWSLTGGQTYTHEIDFSDETITLADQTTESIRKKIAAVEEGGAALTEQTSIATVEANAGSYWHDTANGKLYVHTSGSDTPKGYVLIGLFWLYFATQGKILDGRYYEPYISESGIPSLRQSSPNIHWGVSEIGGGQLRLINSRGYFDQIARAFLWTGKTVRLLLGGDALAYSEYKALLTGNIIEKTFSRESFIIDVKSNAFALLSELPLNKFSADDYPKLDPAAEGRYIPHCYGYYEESQAPEVTCIDTDYQCELPLTYQFKICDHAIGMIIQVYVRHATDMIWQPIKHDHEDLSSATFTILAPDFVLGSSAVKVAFMGKMSDGQLLDKGPYIVEDILTTICGYAAEDLDEPSFNTSKSAADAKLTVYLDTAMRGLTLLERICASDLAYFDESGDGKFRYRISSPYWSGSERGISDSDFVDQFPVVKHDIDDLCWNVQIAYHYNPTLSRYLYAEKTDLPYRYKYNSSQQLTLETYIRETSAALRLAQRIALMTREPAVLLEVDLKMPLIDTSLGEKIRVTMTRAPNASVGGYNDRYFDVIGINCSMFPLRQHITLRDLLMEYGNNYGFWMNESAPNWGSASEQERQSSGFWCDTYGYADPADEDSKNCSLWS